MSAARGSYELVLCGSPRKNGVSSRYAAQLTAELEAKGVVIEHWNVADHAVSGCIGCEGCRRAIEQRIQPIHVVTNHAMCQMP